jgi:hypothetical protein
MSTFHSFLHPRIYRRLCTITPKAMFTGTMFVTQKHKNIPFPPEKRYLWRSAWCSTVQGSRHTWTLQKKHSFEHSFFPATQLFPLRVGCLLGCCVGCCVVVMLLMLSLFTFIATLPTLLPLPPLARRHCRHRHRPLVGEEDDACYTNDNSSPATLGQAVYRALESHVLLDRPLPAGHVGGKGGNDDGSTDGGG